jgi:quercetin dioxygenase-like cupin family protein
MLPDAVSGRLRQDARYRRHEPKAGVAGGTEVRPGKELTMKRHLRMASFVAFACLVMGVAGLAQHGAAQEATPPAGPVAVIELAPGITAEVFAGAPSDRAPGQTVYLARFVFQPGAEIFLHGHPGTTVLAVTSGSFGWTLETGTAYVVRGAAAGATEVTEELTEPGTEVVLEVGDAIYYEEDVTHTAFGAGDAETEVWGTFVLTTGAPLLMPVEATPAA